MCLQLLFRQYDLAATINAALLLSVLCIALSTQLANATDDSTTPSAEYQRGLIFSDTGEGYQFLESFKGLDVLDDLDGGLDTRALDNIRRVHNDASSLGNNQFKESRIKLGETQWWYFPKTEVNAKKSNATSGLPARISVGKPNAKNDSTPPNYHGNEKRSSTVYISLTACSKPDANSSASDNTPDMPQLKVYISQSESLQKPGPGRDDSKQTEHPAHKGYIGTTLNADGNVFIGVTAPNATGYSGGFDYQIAASIDTFFHSVNDHDPFLFFLDADSNAALLVTDNLTKSKANSENYNQWMNITPPYTMFAHNINDTALHGLDRSYCALEKHANVSKKSHDVDASMTNRGLGNKPKEQFYVTGLNQSSFYYGILARDGNATQSGNGIVAGGGKVWRPMNFTTKSEKNCAVLFNLPFCSEVAYAVPSNPNLTNSELSSIYDNHASALFKNFTYSLQQIQCHASNESMYSLAVNCSSCENAYKEWLCAVTIPRCADFTDPAPWLKPRYAGQKPVLDDPSLLGLGLDNTPFPQLPPSNHSRNPIIDQKIHPGPYKEVLPCKDVCYTLVKNCPANLEFACPQGEQLNWSYGSRDEQGMITCNYLGAAYYLSEGSRLVRSGLCVVGLFWVFFWGWFMFGVL